MAEKTLKILPEDFLDKVWALLAEVDEDSSRDELVDCTDGISDLFNEYDPERFPLIVDGELVEEEDQ
jgi:hypothetical protein